MLVFDASPLIVLASADSLSILEPLEQPLVVPERVRTEVVDAGLQGGHADARRLRAAIECGLLSVQEVEATEFFEDLCDLDGLSDTDGAVIAHAAANDAVAVMDEAYGRSIASAENVETRGTAYLVLSQVTDGPLSPAEGRETIDALVDAGWYCSTDLYRRIIAKLEHR